MNIKLKIFILMLFILTLSGCNMKEKNKINISLDLINNKIETTSNLEVELITNEFDYEISINNIDNSKNNILVINNKTIKKKLYTINNNKLTYKFYSTEFLKDNEVINPKVEFITNGGSIDKDSLLMFEPYKSVQINDYNDPFSEDLTIFKKETQNLNYYHKIFLKYDNNLNVYNTVYIDLESKLIQNLELPKFDFILGIPIYNYEQLNDDKIKLLFSEEIFNYVITSNNETLTEENTNLSFYSLLNLNTNFNNNKELPLVYKSDFDFKGWSYNNEIIDEIPSIKAIDHINILKIEAIWDSYSLENLRDYLSNLIPNNVSDNIKLPKKYSGYNLKWISSNNNILNEDGIFTMPYEKENINLEVNAYLENELVYNKNYNLTATFKKSLEIPIASSYIYRNYDLVDELFFETLDIINAAFLIADSEGNLNGTPFLNNVKNYIMPKAKEYGNWVILSIAPESSWSVFARSEELTKRFANNIVDIINEYGFDGVDIDWETPMSHEKAYYTRLMKIVNEKVKANNKNHLVTTAITGGAYQPPMYNLVNSEKYIDYINVMTYGMLNANGQYQNALYPSFNFNDNEAQVGRTITSVSIHESVGIFNDYGVENERLIFGIAFYATFQIKTSSGWAKAANSMHYGRDILSMIESGNYIEYYDNIAKVPYLMNLNKTEFYSYDNPRSISDKSKYVIDNELGGLMFWEYGTDTTNTLLEAIRLGLRK